MWQCEAHVPRPIELLKVPTPGVNSRDNYGLLAVLEQGCRHEHHRGSRLCFDLASFLSGDPLHREAFRFRRHYEGIHASLQRKQVCRQHVLYAHVHISLSSDVCRLLRKSFCEYTLRVLPA